MTAATQTLDLARFLADTARRTNEALDDVLLRRLGRPAASLDPVLRYGTLWGGKRLRPALCVAAYRAAGGSDLEGIYELAASLEFIHAYSLLHDDLPCMDDDDLRRGRPAAHAVFGTPAATVGAAALIPIACASAASGAGRLGLSDPATGAIVTVLCRAAGAGGMIGGQILDLAAEGGGAGLEELERVHALKTGALLSAAAEMGALAAGASPAMTEACAAYGRHLGLAFQIADDVLEATSAADVLGKPVDGDLSLGKSTFPSLLGAAGARERALAEAERARAALRAAGLEDPLLFALAAYAAERDK
ncbi:MAG: polyprenyl synthetase family protein [Gemmatimonadota bacterium]